MTSDHTNGSKRRKALTNMGVCVFGVFCCLHHPLTYCIEPPCTEPADHAGRCYVLGRHHIWVPCMCVDTQQCLVVPDDSFHLQQQELFHSTVKNWVSVYLEMAQKARHGTKPCCHGALTVQGLGCITSPLTVGKRCSGLSVQGPPNHHPLGPGVVYTQCMQV